MHPRLFYLVPGWEAKTTTGDSGPAMNHRARRFLCRPRQRARLNQRRGRSRLKITPAENARRKTSTITRPIERSRLVFASWVRIVVEGGRHLARCHPCDYLKHQVELKIPVWGGRAPSRRIAPCRAVSCRMVSYGFSPCFFVINRTGIGREGRWDWARPGRRGMGVNGARHPLARPVLHTLIRAYVNRRAHISIPLSKLHVNTKAWGKKIGKKC